MKEESLCQTCFCFDCSWHEWFEPVKGWTATPTIIYNTRNNGSGKQTQYAPIKSYCVHDCPLYVDGNKICTSVRLLDIARFLGISESGARRRLKNGDEVIVDGKRVMTIQDDGKFNCFLEEVK